jgi:N-ethylmaleimide reductase
MSSKPSLFSPYQLGPYELPNRVVMAPMTRNRAGEDRIVTPLTVRYYAQRAGAGLIVTEATHASPMGVGYLGTPGIHTEAQVDAWRGVTDAVHDRGGRIFMQLWHTGRISHPSMLPGGATPVAPSAIAPRGSVYTASGLQLFVTPRALETDEIASIVADFANGARQAYLAGFDGVEIHGANGYLIDQFLRDGSNRRTDAYGGTIPNRTRFLNEVIAAVVDVWGGERVGVRLSPVNAYNDMSDSDPEATFSYAAHSLNRYGLAYLHLVDPVGSGSDSARITPVLRAIYRGTLMANGGYGAASGNHAIATGEADLVSFGKPFLANPDLPTRLRLGAPLNDPDLETFYTGGERGYTDYPTLDAHPALAAG